MNFMMIFATWASLLGVNSGQDTIHVQERLKVELENKIVYIQLKLSEDLYKDELINSLREANELLNKECTNSCRQSDVDLQQTLTNLQNTADILKIMVNNYDLNGSSFENQLTLCRAQLAKPTVNQISTLAPRIEEPNPNSCIPFGYYTGIKTLYFVGLSPIRVLCDGKTAGPGWTVIQSRYDGSLDFYRSWAEYRVGFGSLDKEFFIGLENIYHMTNSQRHELYIFVQRFDNGVDWARYDNFFIGSETDNYRLKSLGTYRGSINLMNFHITSQFSTYDRESSFENWSAKYHGGYWYFEELSYGNNLNGRYYNQSNVAYDDGMYYQGPDFKEVKSRLCKMLIRPMK
ncbi:microfibril-associated glycoprotein 4-like isoform X2 [Drosophila novamexicana]|uniref:microfibril-associated glycoprotein 4-like isoform X2 n=1 Tax=Drosophila novamexicana TaxID=47314 RepID=UPI0011E5ACC7|nr:microfibril-associated glycoprotein 4-like isoform X2 [Drosophila novamexicana]